MKMRVLYSLYAMVFSLFSAAGTCWGDIHADIARLQGQIAAQLSDISTRPFFYVYDSRAKAKSVAAAATVTGQQQGGKRRLSLQQTLQLALASNRDVQLSTLYPFIAAEDKKVSQSVYDSTLFAENTYYRTHRPIQSLLDNGTDGTTGKDTLLEDGWNARAGVRKAFATGGIASVFIEADHLDSNSELVLPNPQYTSRLTVQFRQALLKEFGDTSNQSNIEKAGINIRIAEAQYRKTLEGVLRDVVVAYWRFTYYYQQLEINRNAVAAAEKIWERLLRRRERGLVSMLDMDRAEAVLADRRRQLLTDTRNYKTAMNQLKLLMGIPHTSAVYTTDLEPSEEIVFPVGDVNEEQVLTRALEARAEVVIAKLRLESITIDKEVANHKKLPTLDATASYSHNALGENVSTTMEETIGDVQASWTVGLEFEWPMGGRGAEAEYQKVVLGQRKRQIELSQVFEQIGYEVHSANSKVSELLQEREVASQAENAYTRVLQREQSRFELAQVDNQRLLDAQDDYYEAQRSSLRAALNLTIALLDLDWAQGTLLEQLHIDLGGNIPEVIPVAEQ